MRIQMVKNITLALCLTLIASVAERPASIETNIP